MANIVTATFSISFNINLKKFLNIQLCKTGNN